MAGHISGGNYILSVTGDQSDNALNRALKPDTAPKTGSDELIESGGVAAALAELNAALAQKANQTDVDTALAEKADRTAVDAALALKAGKGKQFSVTLTADGWASGAQTVSDEAFLASGYDYIVSPASGSYVAFASSQVHPDDAPADGSLAFYAITTPTAALTVNILRLETSEASGASRALMMVGGGGPGGGSGGDITLASIAVVTPPERILYKAGDRFDPAGMVVRATYSNGATLIVGGYTVSPQVMTAGTTSVTITYTEGGESRTATQDVTVIALTSIKITTPPNKTDYRPGETFNPAGMVVQAEYSDGSTANITGYTFSPETLELGTELVTITYAEGGISVSATQAVTVSVFSATITVTSPVGATLTLTGGGDTQTKTSTGSDTFIVTAAGNYTITATDGENTASGSVEITASGESKTITLSYNQIFGVCWDYGNPSSQFQRLTVANDPNHLVTVDITSEPQPAIGNGMGSSPFDAFYPWNRMEEWNVVDGQITVKHGQPDFSRQANDVVVFVPGYFFYVTYNVGEKKAYYYVSQKAATNFSKHPGSDRCVGKYQTCTGYVSKTGLATLKTLTRATARNGHKGRGAKYDNFDFATLCAAQLLYLVEFAYWGSQEKIGRGWVDGNSNAINSGGCDAMIYHTGRPAGVDGKTAVMYRWIENPWGNVWVWVDGININNRVTYVCTDPSKFADNIDSNGYIAAGVTVPSVSSSYISGYGRSSAFPWAFIPNDAAGAENTYIQDTVLTAAGWTALLAGGAWTYASAAGFFIFGVFRGASFSGGNLGGRLLYLPDANEIAKMAA